MAEMDGEALRGALQDLFGHSDFRTGQREIVEAATSGQDTLAVLPTGGGKSVTYQLPAMLGEGATIVVSPLIALMKDQAENLPPAVAAVTTVINSSLEPSEVGRRLSLLRAGKLKLVYAAPERLRQPPFVHALRRAGVGLVVIDEAHCISQWGHDFRPDYRAVGKAVAALEPRTVLAVTATAPPDVQADIEKQLGRKLTRILRPTWRENLFLDVRRVRSEDEKLWATVELCQQNDGCGLIYATSREKCEQIARMLKRQGVDAGFYHAGLPPDERAAAQDDFMSGRVRVMAATVAFGMGVDKSDIRFLLHYHPSRSLENYYQEAGRAGRDGRPSRCTLLFSSGDAASMTRRLNEDAVTLERVRGVYGAIRSALGRRRVGTIGFAELAEAAGDEPLIRSALPLLEEAGLLLRHPDLPRRVVLSTEFMPGDAEPDPLWEAYASAAHESAEWDTLALAEAAGQPAGQLERDLLALQDAGHLTYRPVAGRTLCLELVPPPENAKARLEQMLIERSKGAASRVAAMQAYARDARCRHQQIARYFGDPWPRRTCGGCDVCVGTPRPSPKAVEPTVVAEGDELAALRLVRDLGSFALGKSGLLRSLRGTPDAPLKPGRARDVGALASWRKADVERLIEALVEGGYLRRDEESEYRSLYLDRAGREALEAGELDLDWRLPVKAPVASGKAVTAEADEPLLAALKSWRRELAAEENVPPYVIFADKVLVEIAARKPTNEFGLLDIPGIGPKKAARFGEIVLELIQKHGA